MSFFYTSIEQLHDNEREQIQNIAIATRGAKTDDFKKFLKSFDKKKTKAVEVDHKANMAMMLGKM